jgi:hypothetical protein
VTKVIKATKVIKVMSDYVDQKVILVYKDLWVLKDLKDHRVYKDLKDLLASQLKLLATWLMNLIYPLPQLVNKAMATSLKVVRLIQVHFTSYYIIVIRKRGTEIISVS